MTLKNFVSPIFWKIRNPDFELENSSFKLLNFFLNVLGVEISDIWLEPSFLKFDKFVNMIPKKFSVVELGFNIL